MFRCSEESCKARCPAPSCPVPLRIPSFASGRVALNAPPVEAEALGGLVVLALRLLAAYGFHVCVQPDRFTARVLNALPCPSSQPLVGSFRPVLARPSLMLTCVGLLPTRCGGSLRPLWLKVVLDPLGRILPCGVTFFLPPFLSPQQSALLQWLRHWQKASGIGALSVLCSVLTLLRHLYLKIGASTPGRTLGRAQTLGRLSWMPLRLFRPRWTMPCTAMEARRARVSAPSARRLGPLVSPPTTGNPAQW